MSAPAQCKSFPSRITRLPYLCLGGVAPLVLAVAHSGIQAETLAAKTQGQDSSIEHSCQGLWVVAASQVGGHQASAEELRRCRVSIHGDVLTYVFGDEPGERRVGAIVLNQETGELDWHLSDLGIASRAIVEVRGDTLKIGFGNFGIDDLTRPQRWDMGEDQVAWLLILKRDQPTEPATAETAVSR